jgi:3-hexulose-6-phosphate synthase/6-phospho-3-hexuloisomerase
MKKSKFPVLQVALDLLTLDRALKIAEEAAEGGADYLEAGTPLIKSEGMEAVRALRARFPDHVIVADLKTLDAGRIEMEAAAKAGADIAVVMAVASEATIAECVRAGANYGIEVAVDLLGAANPAQDARRCEQLGVHHVGVHLSIDDQMLGADPLSVLREVRKAVSIPVAVAGGINSESAGEIVEAGADIIIVGGAVTKSGDAAEAVRRIKKAIETRSPQKTDLYKRTNGSGIRELLEKVSTANISDGSHRKIALEGLRGITPGMRAVGRALTVKTMPGDWAKPVEAIDEASEGDVLVIDAGGVGPAVWGELATHSAIQKKLGGVVINGAVRDVAEIRELAFPVFARLITPQAGEPKGFGEIGVSVCISGVTVSTGDWIAADDDGIMVLESRNAAEIANRAMDWLERENRIRQEIRDGRTTLGKVTELLKWEKAR